MLVRLSAQRARHLASTAPGSYASVAGTALFIVAVIYNSLLTMKAFRSLAAHAWISIETP